MKPLTPTTPHVIIMVGIPGAGKTHFAAHFAKTFSAPFVDTRAIQAHGTSDEATLSLSEHFMDEILKTQRTMVFEGPTHNRTYRHELFKKVKQAGYKPLLVWVQTETNEAKRRSTKRNGAYTPDGFDDMLKRFHPPAAAEKAVVISGKHTYASQVKVVLKHLAGEARPKDTKPEPRIRGSRNILIR